MFKDPAGSFQSVVFSEVLEHMEHPREALEVIRSVMAPDGRLFLNMPINSPAPDHLFNADTPEELEAFVSRGGLQNRGSSVLPSDQSVAGRFTQEAPDDLLRVHRATRLSVIRGDSYAAVLSSVILICAVRKPGTGNGSVWRR